MINKWGILFVTEITIVLILLVYLAVSPSYIERIQRGFHRAICTAESSREDFNRQEIYDFFNNEGKHISQKIDLDRTGVVK